MNSVISSLNSYISQGLISLIRCNPTKESYQEAFKAIKLIPEKSKVIFIGHSTVNTLYGGHSHDYIRQPLLTLEQMSIFRNRELFLISCYSKQLLISSRGYRNLSRCLGFGLLPSEMEEMQSHSGIRKLCLTEDDLDIFKNLLANLISKTLLYIISENKTLEEAYNYLKILINKKSNEAILIDRNPRIGELLYYIATESQLD
ncbi:hypothetical protein [Acinetobacter baumannii]|uniref:hypothetical protein n=1 Tax=Acinetobacter baumannii TaxID=470 RepID=UPI0011457BDD|nr:hypothetical protein [Acinetobacter baumannii]MDV4253056.1 hypothetical protein [Acinetobacter baumannii]